MLALGATAALAPSLLTALQSVNSSPNESGQFDDRQKIYNTELYNALQNLDQRVTELEEPGPPPPPPGLVINDFCDMAVPWNKNVINRYNTVLGNDPWYACDQTTGAPWPSGALFTDGVTTPFGQGFRAIVTPEMDVLSGGKIALFSDIGNIIPGNPGGLVQTWTGSFMFPSGQNPFPRNYPDWGVIWQLHGGGASSNVGPTPAVSPSFVSGNPSCESGTKIDPATSGVYAVNFDASRARSRSPWWTRLRGRRSRSRPTTRHTS